MEYTKIGKINEYVSQSINPMKTPGTTFEMYSVPAYDTGHPEYLRGDEIASSKIIVQKDDILLCKINPRINRVWVVNDESDKQDIASSEWIVIRNLSYNPEFLAWYFRTPYFQKLMTSEVTGIGGSLTRAQPKRVAEYPVPVLERSRQDEIAETLNKVKFIIDARKQELDAFDNLIKSRFVEMFGSVYEDRFPKCILRDVAHIKHGYAFGGEFFTEEDNGIVLVTPGNFALGGGFQEIRNKYFASDYPEEYVLHAGDLIVTMTDLSKKADTLGYGAIVPDTDKVYLHNQRIGLFDQLDERLNAVFVRWYMQTDEYRLEIVRTSTGSTVHHTSPDRILNSVIYLPPIELQKEFVEFAERVDKLKFED